MEDKEMEKAKGETFLDKTNAFIRDNILNILLVVSCLSFVFKDLMDIKQSGNTIPEIIAAGVISFFMSYVIDLIMSKKGTIAGLGTQEYMDTVLRYGREVEKTDDGIDELDDFCDLKNEERLRRIQKRILRKERIRFDKFLSGNKEEVCKTEEQKECWDKAQRVEIKYISAENLLSETSDDYDKEKKDINLQEFEKRQRFTKALSKVLFGIIGGYFSVTFIANGWAGLLWGSIQVSVWLMFGLIGYINNYTYVKNVYRQKIIRKTNYLIEFNNTYKGKAECKDE